jgi:cell division septation protein DedD
LVHQGGDNVVKIKRFSRFLVPILAGLAILSGSILVGPSGSRFAQAASCWQATITEQQTDVDLTGSVLRVSVQGKAGLPVTIRSRGSFEAVGFTGTKPEYGPFIAEFAPMSRGTYFIEPQGLGIIYEVWLDGKNYTRVDFTPLSCAPTATPTSIATARPPAKASATSTTKPATAIKPTSPPVPTQAPPVVTGWHGRVVQQTKNQSGVYWATIAVRVIGRPAGQQVEARSDGWSDVQKTGTKPEHGPDACEFGALNAGTYRLLPLDLNTSLDVTVDHGDFVLVEFTYTGPPPNTRWVGSVAENTSGDQPTEYVDSAIAVAVNGKPWHEVEIWANGFGATCITGYKPEYGPDACEFGGLRAGTYTITPKDLGASVQVTVDGWGWAMVRFDQVAVAAPKPTTSPTKPTAQPTQPAQPTQAPAAGPTATPQPSPTPAGPRWKGWVVSNSSGQQEGTGIWSVVIVRVLNWAGVPVTITGGGGWSATCTTGTKPEYGPDACEFGGLWPGTYYLRPEGADTQVEVEMDGIGTAFVEFAAP